MLRDGFLFRHIHYKTLTAGSGYFWLFSLLRGLGDGRGPLQPGLSLRGDAGQQFLDLGDSSAGVETLGTGLGAVHDGVTPAMITQVSTGDNSFSYQL